MLLTLWRAGYVTLEPEPPKDLPPDPPPQAPRVGGSTHAQLAAKTAGPTTAGLLAEFFPNAKLVNPLESAEAGPPQPPPYEPQLAHPTQSLQKLLLFRGVNPLYGMFLVNQLGVANRAERVQAMESVLELPRSVGRFVRVPRYEDMPPGPLATIRLDVQLLQYGLATAEELAPGGEDEEQRGRYDEDRPRVLALADKLRRLFDFDFPNVHDLYTQPVWAAGEVLEFNGDFNKYITSKGMQKQEGVVFRHLLRLILLIAEFQQLCPPDADPAEWQADLAEVSAVITECCRRVDPSSTEKTLETAAAVAEIEEVEAEE